LVCKCASTIVQRENTSVDWLRCWPSWCRAYRRSIVLVFLRWGRALRGSTPAERIAKNPETSHPVRIDTAKTNRDGERMP
jgi:hypothetical protein